MSKAAICVVVPVYKAMATLDRCVESVLAQQVEGGLTCILVDDGSPDESGALCDAWAAKDDRVTVIPPFEFFHDVLEPVAFKIEFAVNP